MAEDVDTIPVTAQTEFQRKLQSVLGLAPQTSLHIWNNINSFLNNKRQLLALSMGSTGDASLDETYSQVQYNITPYVVSLAAPVLGALAVMAAGIALELGALLTAAITILVFMVLWLRKGGSFDVIRAWIDKKLSVLRPQ